MSWKLRSMHGDPAVETGDYAKDKSSKKEFVEIEIFDADNNLDAVGQITHEQLNADADSAFAPLDYCRYEYGSTTMKHKTKNGWKIL